MRLLAFIVALLVSLSAGAATTAPFAVNTRTPLQVLDVHCTSVAPVSCFFDATGTTSAGVTSAPFFDIQYSWAFGDSGAGNWTQGAALGSRSAAYGPVAQHVYETAGTYYAVLTTYDGTNTNTIIVPVQVTSADSYFTTTKTVCIYNSTLGSGCPAGAATAQDSDFQHAVSTNLTGAGMRLLFKRGDTFTTASGNPPLINKQGPGIIGAYGSGAIPVFESNGTNGILRIGSGATAINDWRYVDVAFDGQGGSTSNTVSAWGACTQQLFLRVTLQNAHGGLIFDDATIAGNGATAPCDQVSLIDYTNITEVGAGGGGPVFIYASRFAMQGANINNQGNAEQNSRFAYIGKGVISNNTLNYPGNTKEQIKLHGPCQSGAGCTNLGSIDNTLSSNNIVISDNKIVGSASTGDGQIVAGPENSTSYELVNTLLVERNWFVAGLSTNQAMTLYGVVNAGVGNNLINFTGSGSHGNSVFTVATRGIETAPANITFYNNSAYSSYASSGQCFFRMFDTTMSNVTIKNNLDYMPSDASAVMVCGSGSGIPTASNNSSNSQIRSTSPNFTATPPLLTTDWKPTAGSYAIGGGTSVPVWSDFFLVTEPGTRDIGAVIH